MAKKSSKKNKDLKTDSKEEVCEIFEVEKKGKEEIKTTCGTQPVKHATKKQIKQQEKILKWVLIVFGILILLFFAGYYFFESTKYFEYKGVEFEIVKEGNLIFYKTSFPVKYGGGLAEYNIFLRNHPKKLSDEIPFHARARLKNILVINTTGDFNCNGDGIIAVANLQQFYNLGGEVIKDGNASCSENGEYMFVQIQEGEESEVVQVGPACYNLNINNCEILEVTERFMLELFVVAQRN